MNLLRKQQLDRVLCNYQQRLRTDENRLLDSDHASVEFWEAPFGAESYQGKTVKSMEELTDHFREHVYHRVKDPRSRHVFISAPHSWAPLKCTPKMLRYLCSYEQISPILIDVLTCFGKRKAPHGSHSASFCQDDLTKSSLSALVGIPEFGRSGWELRHCYKLHGLEDSTSSGAKWTMRQTAIYHSFDLDNGRAVWLAVKANNEIRDRIKDGTESIDAMRALNFTSPGSSFAACLTTHLVTFDWCTENWRMHLDDIDKDAREILEKAQGTPLEPLGDELNFAPRLITAATMPLLGDRQPSVVSNQGTLKARNGSFQLFNEAKARIIKAHTAINATVPEADVEKTREADQSQDIQAAQRKRISDHLQKLKDFSFDEFQRLNFFSAKLQEAKLAICLNMGVLRSTREYYGQRYQSAQFPPVIKAYSESNGSYECFIQRINSLEQDLEANITRIDALILLIEDGKRLYDTILQSYNMEINKLFTLSGHRISERMEESAMRMENVTDRMLGIARATARDSASMSVITLVTLVLLPGTFLGVRMVTSSMKSSADSLTSNQTFFSTPIIGTPEDGNQSWTINWSVFILFIKICAPMTLLVMLIWAVYMVYVKRRRHGPWRGVVSGEVLC